MPTTSRLYLCLSVSLAAMVGCEADGKPGGGWSETAAEAFLSPYVSSGNFSGAVVVAKNGEVFFESSYGRADYELNVPVGRETRFRIASSTKTFTAAAVLLLADREAIELDAPVARYIQGFPHGERITVKHLLGHQSGLPNYYFDLEDYPSLSRRRYDGPADVLELVQGMELRFEPGAQRSYNNLNYTALAWLIEEVSGVEYQEFIHEELLLPLDLRETGYEIDSQLLIHNLAKGHDPVGVDDFQKSRYFDFSISVGAGSMYSTARDLVRWTEAFFGGALLEGPVMEDALEYGWGEQEMHGRTAFASQGWDNVGYSAHLIHIPDEKLTVVVLCNLNIARVVGEIALGLTAIALSEEPEGMLLAPVALPEDSLSPLAGRYQFGDDFYSPGGVLDLVVRDGYLTDIGRDPEASLIPLSDGGFLYRPVWASVEFLAGEDGSVTGLRFYDQFVALRIGSVD